MWILLFTLNTGAIDWMVQQVHDKGLAKEYQMGTHFLISYKHSSP